MFVAEKVLLLLVISLTADGVTNSHTFAGKLLIRLINFGNTQLNPSSDLLPARDVHQLVPCILWSQESQWSVWWLPMAWCQFGFRTSVRATTHQSSNHVHNFNYVYSGLILESYGITVMSNDHQNILIHLPPSCLFRSLHKLASKETMKVPHHSPFVKGIHQSQMDSPHKGPVLWKLFPFYDVILEHTAVTPVGYMHNHKLCFEFPWQQFHPHSACWRMHMHLLPWIPCLYGICGMMFQLCSYRDTFSHILLLNFHSVACCIIISTKL